MNKPIITKEHEEIDIKNCDLDKLQSFLKCKKLDVALKVTAKGIKTNSWVGAIKYKNTLFEILPKCISDNKDENTLKNLIYMLSYTKNLDIKANDHAKLSTLKNPFIEILIRVYAKSLFDCLKRLTPQKYVRHENNLNYLKGKIKFSENIRYNCANRAKFYCEYDEFSENNILNKLFLYVTTCLYNISNNSYNKKTLKIIMNYYSDIEFVRFDKFDVKKITLDRNQELFNKPFNLAKMFVEQTNVDMSKNRFENITLIWDMNQLFEEFIFEIMKKYETELDCKLTAQKGRKLLACDDSKRRNTFVDIMVERKKDGRRIVLDTKYKKFTSTADLSNQDIYQISSYCLIHKANHAILLYPQWNSTKPDVDYYLNIDNFENENKYHLYFKTIDLKYKDLKKNIDLVKDEIKYILDII